MGQFNITTPEGKQVMVTAASPAEAVAMAKRQVGVEGVTEQGKTQDQVAHTLLYRTLTGIPKFFAGAIQKGGDELEKILPITPEKMKFPMMDTGDAIDSLVGHDKSKEFTPETPQGKVAMGMAEGALSGGLAQKGSRLPQTADAMKAAIIGGTGAGGGAEVGAMVGGDNPIARIVGALLGGAASAPASFKATGGGPSRRVNEVAKSVPDLELVKAKELMQAGKQEGVNINVAQAMPGANPLLALSEDAARSSSGPQHTMLQTGQTGQAATAGKKATGLFALPDENPTDVAMRTQGAAEAAVARAKKLPGKVGGPEYDFKQQYPAPGELKQLVGDLDDAVEKMGASTDAGKYVAGVRVKLMKGDKPLVSELEQMKTILNEAKAGIDKPTLKTAGMQGRSAQQAREAIETTLETYLSGKMKNKDAGDVLYKQIHEDIVDPMKRSPVGQIAGPAGLDPEAVTKVDQIFKVLDSPNIRAQSISKMQVDLDKSAPNTFATYAKTAMDRKLEAAFKSAGGDTSMDAPAVFVRSLRGGPEQSVARENFKATMNAAARSQGKTPQQALEFTNGMNKLLDVIEASGRNKVIQTTKAGQNQAIPIATDIAKGATYTPQAPGAASRIIQTMMGGDATRREIFDMIWTPEGVDKIRKFAAMDIPAIRAAFTGGAIIPLGKAAEGEK